MIDQGLRLRVVLIADAADCWETHHFATLLGFGVDAIYPRMAIEVANTHMGAMGVSHYLRAADLGLLKIMSKLGVSTITSYKGAQTFEALGICQDVIDICFKGTISRIDGMTFSALQKECVQRVQVLDCNGHKPLPNLGNFKWRPNGEYHHFNPKSIHLLQHSTRTGDYALFKKYTDEINRVDKHFCTLRSLLDFKGHKPIPLEQVEDEEYILRRFTTGAMSFGSLSYEAHTSLAIAMNRIGAKSNSGEGGEDPARYIANSNGDSLRSSIKQVASGRFGVTIEYLNEADELQIKMAQGAKPGEGGQLPGHKVDAWIARVRHSTPGVGLISPPPHHDIYSIEDLAQLIYDLKNANRDARVSVKLVSKAGVGIIASGVAKGKAEHILISGNDGGTGASPLSSITHAGLPWELGLAETHQTLVRNKLRDRVTLQCDGQIRTGRDLAIATLLGAEEWGIATAALVVQGCILMRKCHLNTCPVGIATQDERLRDKFNGRVEDIVNYFKFLARDLREIMAGLGFRTIDEMVGRADALKQIEVKDHPKATLIDLSRLLHYITSSPDIGTTNSRSQNHGLDLALDRRLIAKSSSALKSGTPVQFSINIRNTHRAVGTMLSSMVYRRFGRLGLPDDTITIDLQGSAGQSFGSFLSRGITMRLEGDANDYVGKGLSGGKLIIRPNRASRITASHNAIIGNVALYGATSGEVYIAGQAGQRFAVRNSGATVVVEGVGNNGCEYMTGGIIVNLGKMGSNFAAGMSGGIAFQYGRNVMVSLAGKTQIQFERLNSHDRETLRALLLKHLEYTSSDLAKSILKNWNSSVRSFVKIIPHEYKKIIHSESKVNHIANALNF